jgi:hypothetical protein
MSAMQLPFEFLPLYPTTRRRLRRAVVALSLVPATLAGPRQQAQAEDLTQVAAGFKKFFMHDECTGQYPPQPDTCAHERLHEKSFVFGGKAGTVYDVTLRIRGIFEPTIIKDGETPYPGHPYFKVGGTVMATIDRSTMGSRDRIGSRGSWVWSTIPARVRC